MDSRLPPLNIPGNWPAQEGGLQAQMQGNPSVPPPPIIRPSDAGGQVITQHIGSQYGQQTSYLGPQNGPADSAQPFPELGRAGRLFSWLLNAVSGTSSNTGSSAGHAQANMSGISSSKLMANHQEPLLPQLDISSPEIISPLVTTFQLRFRPLPHSLPVILTLQI